MLLRLPDAGLGEPRLIPNRRHGCVHEGVGLDKLQGIVRELDGALKGRSWTMTCTATGSRMEGAHTQRAKGQRSAYTITHQGVIITCIEMVEKCNERVGERSRCLLGSQKGLSWKHKIYICMVILHQWFTRVMRCFVDFVFWTQGRATNIRADCKQVKYATRLIMPN